MNRIVRILAVGASALAMVSAAQAADLLVQQPSIMPGFIESGGGNWDGIYLGAFGGYAWGTGVAGPDEWDVSGWLVGGTLGANFTLTEGIVVGVVGDIAWADINGSIEDVESTINWVGSVRGRLGFDGGAFMPYLTGGLGFAGATLDFDDGVATDTDSQTHIGWTAGAGVEFAATEEISLDLQYRYSDYGAKNYTLDGSTNTVGFTTHQLTAGVNLSF